MIIDDPSGNPVERFQPTIAEAKLDSWTSAVSDVRYELRPIGAVHSPLVDLTDAPRQGDEGAPEAWIELHDDIRVAMNGLHEGDAVVIVTWLDRADRGVLEVHPRSDPSRPLQGVFATRSPDRPNPIGLHEVRILTIAGTRMKVDRLEVIDGTPVLDVKPVLHAPGER